MFEIYLFCATVGGTLLVIQTMLTALGLGESDTEIGDDVSLGLDVVEAGGDLEVTGDADAGGFDLEADTDAPADSDSHGSLWLFRMLSFRTLVAATTFFGLSGAASLQSGLNATVALVIALVVGICAMVAVHGLMRTLSRLSHDGTVRITDAVGKPATVYLPIPANREGAGRVQVRMDDRIMEYEAVSSNQQRLKTGAKVVVVGILGPATIEVEPEGTAWNRDPLYRASQITLSDHS